MGWKLDIDPFYCMQDVGRAATEIVDAIKHLDEIIPNQFTIDYDSKGWYVETDTGKKYRGTSKRR